MKVSIIIPVYYNQENLPELYEDLKKKVLDVLNCKYELVMVNDGSKDKSYQVMQELQKKDQYIKIYSLSRNFGSHAAVLCGLEHCTGDCAVIKAADLQEPSELILDMIESWKLGNNVVLAVRQAREEGKKQVFFANLYYWIVRKFALKEMPQTGFDVFLIDRKVIQVLSLLEERNSSITGQILWSGFKTTEVPYIRKERRIGTSKWTLQKKIRLVADTLFSFSNAPINFVFLAGILSVVISFGILIVGTALKIFGYMISLKTSLIISLLLFLFGVQAFFTAILGEYLWRILDASRNRPVYIIEEKNERETE